MPSHRSDQDLADRLRESACGFAAHGVAYWPGAAQFLLLEVNSYGSGTGEAHIVCHAWVREAAQLVMGRLTLQRATRFDLVGVGEGDIQKGLCYICGELLG